MSIHPVDAAVMDAKDKKDELMRMLDEIAAKYEDPDELHWRRRMALAIHHYRLELKRRA